MTETTLKEKPFVWIGWGQGESATPIKYEFDSDAELDAFLLGVGESDGWDNWTQCDTQEELDAWKQDQQYLEENYE